MISFQQLSFVGSRGKCSWVTDLMAAAENHQSVAYVACFFCLTVMCVQIVFLFAEYKRRVRSEHTYRTFDALAVKGLLGLAIPAMLFFWLASRLVS